MYNTFRDGSACSETGGSVCTEMPGSLSTETGGSAYSEMGGSIWTDIFMRPNIELETIFNVFKRTPNTPNTITLIKRKIINAITL